MFCDSCITFANRFCEDTENQADTQADWGTLPDIHSSLAAFRDGAKYSCLLCVFTCNDLFKDVSIDEPGLPDDTEEPIFQIRCYASSDAHVPEHCYLRFSVTEMAGYRVCAGSFFLPAATIRKTRHRASRLSARPKLSKAVTLDRLITMLSLNR